MLQVFDCTSGFLFGLFVFLMVDINAFIESPSYTLLGKCMKEQLLRIADHYEIDVVDKKRKESIKAELKLKLCERDILSMDKDLIVSAQMQSDSPSVLTFEQQKELLLLQMEHERLKQHSEYDRMELEKAKIEVEVLKLRLMKEGREDRVTFAVNSNLKFVPKFNEEDPDIFFTLFERIAELQDWSEENRVLLLQCVLTGKAQLVFFALSKEDCQDYDQIKSAVLKAYECVPEAYRQQFMACKREQKQSHLEFVQDLRKYFTRWYTALDITSFDELVQLMILEQFKVSI